MNEERESTLLEIKSKIDKDNYRVDTLAVADAIVRRIRELAMASAERAVPRDRLLDPDWR